MTEYSLRESGTLAPAKEGRAAVLAVMSSEEFRQNDANCPFRKEMQHNLGSIRYCKADLYKNFIFGTVRVPKKEAQRTPELTFAFALTKDKLYLVENTGELRTLVSRLVKHSTDIKGPQQVLLDLFELMIENDVPYLAHMESEVTRMEDEISSGAQNDFFLRLTRQRRALSELGAYYDQLSDIGERLASDVCRPISGESEGWERFARRAERLQDHTRLVSDFAMQLRELYSSEQDAKQNKIMGILTVVTTLFLPLTLLTGWYGMNFRNMPELSWQYGYIVVAAVAAVIIIIEILVIKKKFKK